MDSIDQFKKLDNDNDRWKWILKNKHLISVDLDNDVTYINIERTNDYVIMDDFIGDEDGIIILLNAFGIRSQRV